MKRPLVLVALVYAAGILAGDICPVSPAAVIAIALSFAVLTIVGLALEPFTSEVRDLSCAPASSPWRLKIRVPRLSGLGTLRSAKVFFWPLVFLTGWANLACRTVAFSPYDLRKLQLKPTELVTLRGVLSETPTQRVFVQDERESFRSLATLRTSGLRHNESEWQPASGAVLVLTPGTLPPRFFAGQEVAVVGVLSRPPGPAAEGLFDYAAYLRRQSVYYQLRTDGTNDWALLSSATTPPFSDRFINWAQRTLAHGLPEEDDTLHMLWAMTLGWKTVNNEIYEPFMRSGTMHVFAISGLHIALIAGILVALLRVFRVPRFWSGPIVLPLIWFYTVATGWQPSAIRSAIMMSIVIGGWALARPSDLVNSLAAAACCVLLWDPQQLFGASFQLSFFVVLSIALLLPVFEKTWQRWFQRDPLLPAGLVPAWKVRLFTPLRWVAGALAISLASWIGSLPLTAYYFHLFSPITLLANLLVVPLSSLALAASLGSLLCGSWLVWVSDLFNHAAWFFMHLMIRLSQASASLPGGSSYVQSPSLLTIALFYALVVGLLTRWLLTGTRRRLLVPVVLAAGCAYGWQWYRTRSSVSLTVLPVSGGYAVYSRNPGLGTDLLIDCGRSNAVRFVTSPFLRARGLDHIPSLLLSHGDIRHIGGAPLLAADFTIDQVCASSIRFRSPAWRRDLAFFQQTPGLLQTISLNNQLGPWRILHPDPAQRLSLADDNSTVLLANFGGTRVLLLSDLGPRGQFALLQKFPDLRADILVTGIPTSGEPVCQTLLQQLQPRLVVIADSEFPVSERASPALRERLSALPIPVVYTRYYGAATLECRQRTWRLRTMSGLSLLSAS